MVKLGIITGNEIQVVTSIGDTPDQRAYQEVVIPRDGVNVNVSVLVRSGSIKYLQYLITTGEMNLTYLDLGPDIADQIRSWTERGLWHSIRPGSRRGGVVTWVHATGLE